jgi:alpha-L-fucosidase 2
MPSISRRRFLRDAAIGGAALSQRRALALMQNNSDAADWTRWKLFYDRPAPTWPDALPVGNGRLGAMVFGSPAIDRVQLNEESIWDGERRDRDNPRAGEAVPEIRRLLFAGKVHEAEAMAVNDMLSVPRRMPCYQTLGDLHLDFGACGLTPSNDASGSAAISGYRLELDLDQAIASTTFLHQGIRHTREIFVSAPDQVIVVRLSVNKPDSLSFVATLDRPGNHQCTVAGPLTLALSGEALPVNDNPGPCCERAAGRHTFSRSYARTRRGRKRTRFNSGSAGLTHRDWRECSDFTDRLRHKLSISCRRSGHVGSC